MLQLSRMFFAGVLLSLLAGNQADIGATTLPMTSAVKPLNCLFLLDWSYISIDADYEDAFTAYIYQQSLVDNVASALFNNTTLNFGAAFGIYGYTDVPNIIGFPNQYYSNSLDFKNNLNQHFPSVFQSTDICKAIDVANSFSFPKGFNDNTCLVFFTGSSASACHPFKSKAEGGPYDKMIAATLNGFDFKGLPLVVSVSNNFDSTDVNNLVNAMISDPAIIMPAVKPLNCLFLLDWSYINVDLSGDYMDSFTIYLEQQSLVNNVASALFNNATLNFGAGFGIYGYTDIPGVTFNGYFSTLSDFSTNVHQEFPSLFSATDICKAVDAANNFVFPKGSNENTCLVFFTGQSAAHCSSFKSVANGGPFKTMIAATLNGVQFKELPDVVRISNNFDTTDVNNVVQAILSRAL